MKKEDEKLFEDDKRKLERFYGVYDEGASDKEILRRGYEETWDEEERKLEKEVDGDEYLTEDEWQEAIASTTITSMKVLGRMVADGKISLQEANRRLQKIQEELKEAFESDRGSWNDSDEKTLLEGNEEKNLVKRAKHYFPAELVGESPSQERDDKLLQYFVEAYPLDKQKSKDLGLKV